MQRTPQKPKPAPKDYPDLPFPTLPMDDSWNIIQNELKNLNFNQHPSYSKINDQLMYTRCQNFDNLKKDVEILYKAEKDFEKNYTKNTASQLNSETSDSILSVGGQKTTGSTNNFVLPSLKTQAEKYSEMFEVERYNSKTASSNEQIQFDIAANSINWDRIPLELHLTDDKSTSKSSRQRKVGKKFKVNTTGTATKKTKNKPKQVNPLDSSDSEDEEDKADKTLDTLKNTDMNEDKSGSESDDSSKMSGSEQESLLSEAESENDLDCQEFDNGDDYEEKDEL